MLLYQLFQFGARHVNQFLQKNFLGGLHQDWLSKHQAVLASCCREGEEEVGQSLNPSFPRDSRADQVCRRTCTPAKSMASEKKFPGASVTAAPAITYLNTELWAFDPPTFMAFTKPLTLPIFKGCCWHSAAKPLSRCLRCLEEFRYFDH